MCHLREYVHWLRRQRRCDIYLLRVRKVLHRRKNDTVKKSVNLDSEPETVMPGETDFNYGYNVMEQLYWDNGDPIYNPGTPYEQWEQQTYGSTIQRKVVGRASADSGSKVLEERSEDRRNSPEVL